MEDNVKDGFRRGCEREDTNDQAIKAAHDSVTEFQLIAQDVLAVDRVDGGLVLPALTGEFATDVGELSGNRAGQLIGQIEVAPDAFIVGTSEAEHRLGVLEVNDVFDFPVLAYSFWVVIAQRHFQGPQLLKFVGQAGRGFDPLAFLIAIFSSEPYFLSIHDANLS
jgi:hypothetical protein